MNRLYTRASLLLAAMLLASACTGASTAQPTSAPAATQGTEATQAPADTSAPAATQAPQSGPVKDVPREQTYVVTLWSDTGGAIPAFDNWNPLMNAGNALRGNGGNAGISEGLFYRNLNDGTETPWLGESYKSNADFTQWTINLRKGVEWSDGQPFNCTDVKFTIDTVIAGAPDMNQSSYFK